MNVIFTCGGTAGHIYPAVGIANLLKQRHANANILFAGAHGGMETRLVPKEGYEIRTVNVKNLRHSLSPGAVVYNVKVLAGLAAARRQARQILQDFKPDVVVGTGGYASFPITSEAAKLGIPTVVHESNAMPGWTTRMLAGKVDDMLVSFEESKRYYTKSKRVTLAGTPVRGAFIGQDKRECRRALSFGDPDKPLVLSFWGSLGARDMNRMMLDCIELEAKNNHPFRHIHACGKSGFVWMTGQLSERGVNPHPDVELREFIFDMPLLMNASDLVLCRAGASTLAELCASASPSILVPSPNVTNNHQDANARVLERAGAALRIPESDCTGEVLYSHITRLLEDGSALESMSQSAAKIAVLDASERIYQIIMSHISGHKT